MKINSDAGSNSSGNQRFNKDHFYESATRHSQIINVIVPEGFRDQLNIKAGDEHYKLCLTGLGHCFRARIVVLASNWPTFATFSKYRFVSYIPQGAAIIVTEDQLKFMIEDIKGSKLEPDFLLPKQTMNVKVAKNATDLDILTLKSGVQSKLVGNDPSRDGIEILNFREIRDLTLHSVSSV